MAFTLNTNLAGDGEFGGVFAILPKQVRKEAPPCVYEPVTYLGKEEGFSNINKTAYMDDSHLQKNKLCSFTICHEGLY